MEKPKIFLSYRRSQSAAAAIRIFDKLVQYYGIDSLFTYIYDFPPGYDFQQFIDQQISECYLVLVLIDLNWLSTIQNRSNDPKDYFRVEIETALRLDVPIIPILLSGDISMPSETDLPNSIKAIANRTGIVVDPGSNFQIHMERLKDAIDCQFYEIVELNKKQHGRLANDNENFIAPWLLGSWDNGKKIISKRGFSQVRMYFPEGKNKYEYDITINDDIIVFYGTFEDEYAVMKWRKISNTRCQYFYHYFNKEEHDSHHIFDKDPE